MRAFPVSSYLLKLYSFSPSIFSLTLEDCYKIYDEIMEEIKEELEVEEDEGRISPA